MFFCTGVVLLVILLGLLLCHSVWVNGHFKRCKIKCGENALPFFGHIWKNFFGMEHFVETISKLYNTFTDEKYIGFIAFRDPVIILKDLELIKQIGVKDFDKFVDHRVFMDEDADPLFGKNLFFLKGQKWREMRITMSPAYTSSKMKNMFPMFVECAEQCVNYFMKQANTTPSKELGYIDVEMKDVFSKYTSDVIASSAFGLRTNSFEEPNNEFYQMGKIATNFSGIQFLKFFGYASIPRIMKFFKISLFSRPVATYFRKLVHDNIRFRERNGTFRPDMIHLLMLAKKGSLNNDNDSVQIGNTGFAAIQETVLKQGTFKREWSEDDLTAQAMAFLLAGFDTSSSLICFIAYELALNHDIQERLQREIDDVMMSCDGNLTYNDLINMKYIDMVVSETLRKWPPDDHLERICTVPYTLPPPNDRSNKSYVIKKGNNVWIPTSAIHRDPKYYPNPDVFNPERFSDENKPNLVPNTFISFGIGPRFCIGARFAVMEAKVIIFYLLAYFTVVKTPKSIIPIKLAKDTFIMQSEGGFNFGLKLRKKNE